jgi:hypothetical protein
MSKKNSEHNLSEIKRLTAELDRRSYSNALVVWEILKTKK